jgi:tetratricopeptide (TPR) repeat protein
MDIAPELVSAELERILATAGFRQSESLARLLRYVATETLAGRATQLKEYTLGVEVFQRGTGFDPKIDTIVRTQARRLRAKLDEYYTHQGLGDDVVIELPKGAYVPVFRRRLRPVSYALKWAHWQMAAGAALAILTLSLLIWPLVWGVGAARPAAVRSAHELPETAAGPLPATLRLWVPEPTRSEAYQLYIKGRLGLRNPDSLAYLDRALQIDPAFAPAWLARAEFFMSQNFAANQPPARVLPQAREAAMRAIRLGYDVAAAHQVLAAVSGTLEWDWERAERSLLRAVELESENAWTRLAYAGLLARRGASVEALEQLHRMGALDASAPTMASVLASVYFMARQYDRVIEVCRSVIDSTGDNQDCHYWMGRALLSKGLPAEAVAHLEMRRPTEGQGFGSLVSAYLAAGRTTEAIRLREDAERRAARVYVSPVSLAQTYFAFGELDAGFRQLDRALEVRDQSLATLKVEPAYDRVRDDPRFQRVLGRLRL